MGEYRGILICTGKLYCLKDHSLYLKLSAPCTAPCSRIFLLAVNTFHVQGDQKISVELPVKVQLEREKFHLWSSMHMLIISFRKYFCVFLKHGLMQSERAITGCKKQTHWPSKTWKPVLYKRLIVWVFCCFLVMAAFIQNTKSSSSILFRSHEFTPAQMAGCLLPNELWIRLIFYHFIYNSPISNCYFFIVCCKSFCYSSHMRNTCMNTKTSLWNNNKKKSPNYNMTFS